MKWLLFSLIMIVSSDLLSLADKISVARHSPRKEALSNGRSSGIQAYLEINGQKTDPKGIVSLDCNGSTITAHFKAPADGKYRFGIAIEADEIQTLELGKPVYNAESLNEPVVIPYPYDWTYVGQNNVLNRPRMVMPGVIFNGQVYLMDTRKLFSITLEKKKSQVRALFLKHNMYNDGADVGTSKLSMSAGQTAQINIMIFDNVDSANEKIYGKLPPINGRMAYFFYKEWDSKYFTPTQSMN